MSKGAAGVDFTHFLAMEWAARHDAAASDFTLCAALRQRYDAETRKKAASIGQTMTDLDTSVVAAMQRRERGGTRQPKHESCGVAAGEATRLD